MGRIVVGVSGASGMPLVPLLVQALTAAGKEVHLIVSEGACEVLRAEGLGQEACGITAAEGVNHAFSRLCAMAHTVYHPADLAAGPASGSWQHEGMLVCPCSMATLAAIALGVGSNVLHRAADVTLKEGRPLILVPRETPLSRIHLRNMLAAQEAGAVIMPFCPAFYGRPTSIEHLLEHMVGRLLDQLAIPHNMGHRWTGTKSTA